MNPGPMKKPTNSAALAAAFGRSENAVVTRLVRLRAGLLPEPAVSFGNAPEESSKPAHDSATCHEVCADSPDNHLGTN